MGCPNSNESGCFCPEHHPGLLAYVPQERQEAFLAALTGFRKATEPRRLSVVSTAPEGCTGSMVCQCAACNRDRAELRGVKKGSMADHNPWMPRRRAA